MQTETAILTSDRRSKGIDISFENIVYSVEAQKQTEKKCGNLPCFKEYEEKHIIDGVSGIARAGEVTAIMGASGAGKTTLLNILACRIDCENTDKVKPGIASGKIQANGSEYKYSDFRNFANYVMQEDVLLQSLTVRETLEYVGSLTINLPEPERKLKIQTLTNNLKLQKCIDTLVGGSLLKGISGGQKKRTSIAFELMSDPQVLVLDEPTSGLDSLTAYIISSYLHRLARQTNKTIIMTIHQPNSEIFALFDRLIFLVEGKCVYQGLASRTVDYFSQIGFTCPQFSNPPDYIMSIMHHQSKVNRDNFPLYTKKYEEILQPEVRKMIANKNSQAVQTSEKVKPPFCQRLGAILKRDLLNTTRNPMVVRVRILQSVIMGLLVGGVYFAINKDFGDTPQSNLNDQSQVVNFLGLQGLLFFISMMGFMSSLSPVSIVFPKQRLVFLKQEGSRLYNTGMFVFSRNIVQLPYLILIPLIMQLIFYWMIGLGGTAEQFFTFYLIFFLISFAGNSMGLLLGSMVEDVKLVSLLIPIFILPFVLFSGFYKNRQDLPVWLSWIEYISPLKYSFISFIRNELLPKQNDDYPLSLMNFEDTLTLWNSIFILLGLTLTVRFSSFLFLHFGKSKPQ